MDTSRVAVRIRPRRGDGDVFHAQRIGSSQCTATDWHLSRGYRDRHRDCRRRRHYRPVRAVPRRPSWWSRVAPPATLVSRLPGHSFAVRRLVRPVGGVRGAGEQLVAVHERDAYGPRWPFRDGYSNVRAVVGARDAFVSVNSRGAVRSV